MSVSEAQFEGWIVEHYPAVYRRCFYLLGDPVEAEDAAQETFLRAFQARERYDPARPVRPWLLTMATRHCIDRLRRRQRRGPEVPWNDGRPAPRDAPGPEDPEARILTAEDAQAVRAAVAALPPLERTLVVLHYWEELSYEAIAAQTGLSLSAVKSRLYRARQRLARMLQTTRP